METPIAYSSSGEFSSSSSTSSSPRSSGEYKPVTIRPRAELGILTTGGSLLAAFGVVLTLTLVVRFAALYLNLALRSQLQDKWKLATIAASVGFGIGISALTVGLALCVTDLTRVLVTNYQRDKQEMGQTNTWSGSEEF